jgi:hypothetical protein
VLPTLAASEGLYVMRGSVDPITVPDGARLLINAGGAVGAGSTPPSSGSIKAAACFRLSPSGTLFVLGDLNYAVRSTGDRVAVYSTGVSGVLGGGTYDAGLCLRNIHNQALDNNDYFAVSVVVLR